MSFECTVTDEDVAFVRRMLESFKRAALIESPYYGLLVSRLRVEATCQVPIAATNGATLLVNPHFFRQIYKKSPGAAQDAFNATILHELEHITRLHPFRLRSLISSTSYPPRLVAEAFNIVSDAQINSDLAAAGYKLPKGVIFPDTARELLGVEVMKRPVEDAVIEYLRKLPPMLTTRQAGGQGGGGGSAGQGQAVGGGGGGARSTGEEAGGAGGEQESQAGGQRSQGPRGGAGEEDLQKPLPGGAPRDVISPERRFSDSKVVQEGDPEIRRALEGASDPDSLSRRLEDTVKRIITDAYTGAKAVGKLPGHIERIVRELLKPAEDWRNLIRSALQGSLGSSVRRTWSIPNRKLPGARPGRVTRGVDEVYVLMDVSGSIGERELARFASEIAGIAKEVGAKVTVIPWDVGVRGRLTVRNRTDASRIKVTGGGGTELLPSLREALKIIKPGKPVVILSDWATADDPAKLIQELEKLARTNELVLASVHSEPPRVRGAKTVKLPV